MARTTRRRDKSNYSWILSDWVKVNGFYQYVSINKNSEEGKKLLALYHSDHGHGRYGYNTAPHWYRRNCNKEASNIEKNELHLWIKYGEQYEVPKPKRVCDASWYW